MSDPSFFGITSLEIIPQSDFSASGTETGRWEATQSFKAKQAFVDSFNGQQTFAPGVKATALDSSLPAFWNFLSVTHTDKSHEDGGWLVVVVHYSGYWSASYDQNTEDRPTTYSLSGTLEEVSVMEHPTVVALADVERAQLSQMVDGVLAWDGTNVLIQDDSGEFTKSAADQNVTTTNGIAFATLIANGITTYKRPSFTWTKTQESTDPLAGADLNNLGKISVPDGDPPEPNGSRDWMLISADSVQHGTTEPTYTNTTTHLLSERQGWDSDLYS